ncbi:MAG TPA: LamG-like jellyroll fold domain-containing protein, partial [Legionellaceae bacterium]|nr:LamG-like jellyroll fold domain-containing protein [Legionellaceae bacterium]
VSLNTWQPFDFLFVSSGSNTDIRLQVNGGSGSCYVEFDDVTVSLDTGIRNDSILSTLDGDMEQSGTSYWTASGSTLSKIAGSRTGGSGSQILRVTGNGGNSKANQSNIFIAGKTYRVTGWVKNDGTSGSSPVIQTTASQNIQQVSNPTSWTYIDATFVPTANTGITLYGSGTGSGHYDDWDDVTVTEVDPLSGVNTNGVTVGAAANGHLTNAYSFDGTNDNVNIYSGSLNSAFNPNEGTIVAWAKVSGSGVYTDGTTRYIASFRADSNNEVDIRKPSTNNQLVLSYSAGGIQSQTSIGTTPTGWTQLVITWSKSNDQVKAYINGVQQGSTLNGLGTWVGNFVSTTTEIGALNNTGSNDWSGLINDVRLYNRALSPNEISQLYNYAPGPVAYYKMDEGTGTNVNDSSGNGNTGTWNGTLGSQWASGKYGKAGNFNGTDNYVNTNTTFSSTFQGSYTVSFWMKPTNGHPAGLQTLFGDSESSSCGGNICIVKGILNTDGTVEFQFQPGGATTADAKTNAAVFASGQTSWTYVTIVANSTTNGAGGILIYINGQLVTLNGSNNGNTSGITFSGYTAINKIFLGARDSGSASQFFNGQLDDFKIYNYVRTPSQILDDMNGGQNANNLSAQGNSLPKPLDYWKFNEGYG